MSAQLHQRRAAAGVRLLAAALCVACFCGGARAQRDPFDAMSSIDQALARYEALPEHAIDCGGPPGPFTAARTLTLPDALERALCANPRVRQAWSIARLRAAQVGTARAADLPTLTFTGQFGRSGVTTTVDELAVLDSRRFRQQRNMSLALGWILYDSGLRAGNIAVAEHTLAAAHQNQRVTLMGVLLETAQAYYEWRSAQGVLVASVEAERVAARAVEFARARQQVGSSTLAERLQAETAHAQAVVDRVQAEGLLSVGRAALAILLAADPDNLPSGVDAEAQRPRLLELDLPALTTTARERSPAVRMAKSQMDTARARIQVADATSSPTLGLTVGFVRNRQLGSGLGQSFTTTSPSATLQLGVPLYDGGARAYQLHAARAQLDVSEHALAIAVREVELEVWKAYHDMVKEAEKLRHGHALMASAQQAHVAGELRYAAGAGTVLELLTARSALAAARKQQVQSAAAWRSARARLVFLTAQPLEWEADDENWAVHARR